MHYQPNQIPSLFYTGGIASFQPQPLLDCCISYGGGYGNRTHLNILLARQASTPCRPIPHKSSRLGTTPIGNDKSVDLLASVKRRLLSVRLFIFLYANPYAKRGTIILVGVPNSPFFGPRGEGQGCEDMFVITLGLRRLLAAPTTLRVKGAR